MSTLLKCETEDYLLVVITYYVARCKSIDKFLVFLSVIFVMRVLNKSVNSLCIKIGVSIFFLLMLLIFFNQ